MAKIVLIDSKKKLERDFSREWLLNEGHKYIMGRKSNIDIDIDLSFDQSVSRFHAEIWYEDSSWWIKDNSRYGTKINGEKIAKAARIELKFDDEITVGSETTLAFIPARRKFCYWNKLWIGIESADSLNYALLHNGFPFIEKIILHNRSGSALDPLKFCLNLAGYFEKTFEIPGLKPNESFIFNPDTKVNPETLESHTETISSFLKVYINKSLILEKKIRILAHNEWSKENIDYHRTSLASFVLPNHPFIQQIVTEVMAPFKKRQGEAPGMSSLATCEAFYDYFQKQWDFEYVNELSSFEAGSQKIRLPHMVFLDWASRKAKGTCIDLSLLFSSCLENSAAEPLLLIFEMKDRPGLCHAIVGCSDKPTINEPLFTDRALIDKGIVVMDPTGFAKGLKFKEAKKEAEIIFKNNDFVFGLDIKAARRYNVLPLPFSGQPKDSPMITKVDKKAKELADQIGEDTGYKVYTPVHILLALLLAGDGFTREVFKQAGLNIDDTEERLQKGLRAKPDKKVEEAKPSEHYDLVYANALKMAKDEGSPFILEKHLFLALLDTRSGVLDKAVAYLNTNREVLKDSAYQLLKIHPFSEKEKSFFGSVYLP